MFLYINPEYTVGFDPLALLLMTLIIGTYTGRFGFHAVVSSYPVKIVEKITDWFDHKLNRKNRSQIDRSIRGTLTSLVILFICGAFGWGIAWLSQTLPFAWILETILLIILINPRSIHHTVRQIETALRDHGLEVARQNIALITNQASGKIDRFGVARIAIEFLATSLTLSITAPIFWYILIGFPGLMLYQAVVTMDKKLGQQTKKYQNFGFASAKLKDIFIALPAQLSGLMTLIASFFIPTSRTVDVLTTILKDAHKCQNYNLGVSISAFAGALNIALSGPKQFTQAKQNSPWIGSGTAQATHKDIRRGLCLYNIAYAFNGLFLMGLIIYRYI
jgi:adenosylcobinamide-phosphate synthase